MVVLQHADGRTALIRGDVDAWAGLDPIMASAEVEDGAVLLHCDPAANTWGILNVREAFLEENPAIVERVLMVYEAARHEALADPAGLKRIVAGVTGLPAAVVDGNWTSAPICRSPASAPRSANRSCGPAQPCRQRA